MKESFTISLSIELCKVLDSLVAKYGSDRSDYIAEAVYNYFADDRKQIVDKQAKIWDKESSDCDLWQKDRTCIGCYRYDICKQAEQNKIKP